MELQFLGTGACLLSRAYNVTFTALKTDGFWSRTCTDTTSSVCTDYQTTARFKVEQAKNIFPASKMIGDFDVFNI